MQTARNRVYCAGQSVDVLAPAPRLCGMNGLKSWLKNRWCCFNAQAGAGTTKQLTLGSRCDRQCKGNQRRSGSVWSKRMINVLIVVLRAVVAVSNAVIAVLELIRQFFD